MRLKLFHLFLALGLALSVGAGVVLAGGPPPPGAPLTSPEIDPGSMASALTLLVGGVLLVKSRFRR